VTTAAVYLRAEIARARAAVAECERTPTLKAQLFYAQEWLRSLLRVADALDTR
jgi:hypothetical protein